MLKMKALIFRAPIAEQSPKLYKKHPFYNKLRVAN